jgi:hypothetical protein
MGLFDFLKRKPDQPPRSQGPSPDYAFADVAIRQLALAKPLQFLAIALSPNAAQFFDALLEDVSEYCERKASFDSSCITTHQCVVNGFPSVVIVLPEPKEMAEVYMVALVVPIDMSSDEPPNSDVVQARYFTLEKGFSLSGTPRTVLAEWDTTSHSNYGDGPTPNVEAFVQSIEHLIKHPGI